MSLLINYFANPFSQIYAAHVRLSAWLAIDCSMIKLQLSLPWMNTDFLSCHRLPQAGLGSHFPSPSWDSGLCWCSENVLVPFFVGLLSQDSGKEEMRRWEANKWEADDDAHSWRDAWWPSSPSELPICCFIPNFQKSHIFLFRLCLHFPPQERESVNSPQGLLGSLVQSLQDVAQSLHSIQQHNSPSSSCCVTSLRMVFFRDCYASGVLIFYLDIY